MELFSVAFSLFLLMDPFGNIPIFTAVLKDIPRKKQAYIIMRELIIALVVIVAFYYVGDLILHFLGISQESVSLAGGIILFVIAMKMVFPADQEESSFKTKHEPFIVPLAIPMVAGPSILAAVMIFSHDVTREHYLLPSIVIAWLASTGILLSSTMLTRLFGHKGLVAIERLMGLILTLIAIQMFLEGINLFIEHHHA